MCWRTSHGGLQVTSVKYKAQAILIKTFLETAATPKFRHSLLHSILFRFHVLGDTTLPDPGYLPYYPPSFFQTIRHVHLETPLNILSMTTGQWVRILTEDGLTIEIMGDQHQTHQWIVILGFDILNDILMKGLLVWFNETHKIQYALFYIF